MTRVPHVFPIYGTIVYAGCSITALACFFAIGIAHWTPPWYITMPAFLYCFISAGIITMGRIESNKDAKIFAHLLRKQSEINKRNMN
jgi:Na+/glutamate symporter